MARYRRMQVRVWTGVMVLIVVVMGSGIRPARGQPRDCLTGPGVRPFCPVSERLYLLPPSSVGGVTPRGLALSDADLDGDLDAVGLFQESGQADLIERAKIVLWVNHCIGEFDCTTNDTSGPVTLVFNASADIASSGQKDVPVGLCMVDCGAEGFDLFPECVVLVNRQETGTSAPIQGRIVVMHNAGAGATTEATRFNGNTHYELPVPTGDTAATGTGIAFADLDGNSHDDVVVCGWSSHHVDPDDPNSDMVFRSWVWVLWE